MALTERTRSYEYLIRVNEDNSIGAQKQSLTEILKDGIVISAVVNPPEGLTDAEKEIVAQFAGVLQ